MDIIDRYFRTLRIFLPNDQRDDIIRELSEAVPSQVAEREASLGRPLNEDERASIIGQYGHPFVTAARYRPQRHLIGPGVFPYYWIVLKIALALVALGHLLGAIVLLGARLAGRDVSLLEFVNYVWSIVFILVATASIWGSVKSLLRRVRGTATAAHA